jgi:hypothetical protein
MKGKSWTWVSMALLTAAVLVGSTLGCYPASSSRTPETTPKRDKQPDDKKDEPLKPPKADPG